MSELPFLPLAYIDPGTGSMLVQVIIGTLLAMPFFLRSQIGRVYRALRGRREPPPDEG